MLNAVYRTQDAPSGTRWDPWTSEWLPVGPRAPVIDLAEWRDRRDRLGAITALLLAAPVARAVRVRTKAGRELLIVAPCPLCGKRHRHDAPRPAFGACDGIARPHCRQRGGYLLREVRAKGRDE